MQYLSYYQNYTRINISALENTNSKRFYSDARHCIPKLKLKIAELGKSNTIAGSERSQTK